MHFDKILQGYDYYVPIGLIAQKPAHPRDAAKLLVYDRKSKKVCYDNFKNLGKYLPKNSVLVFNQTKVVPARLTVFKPTGGKAEILYIDHNKTSVKTLSNRPLNIGSTLSLPSGRAGKFGFKVLRKEGQFYFLKPNFPVSNITSMLSKYGQTPLPPYIKNSPLTEKQKRQEYQSIFAKQGLSVAAPTASLHFSKSLVAKLKKQGIEVKFITLNVNLGTFAPLKEENLNSGKLHVETYEIPKKTAEGLEQARNKGKKIIAVGTTVVRTLESYAAHPKLQGSTDLFIKPGYKFRAIDGMVTNFHVPKSSLMMLVSSLTGRKQLLGLYHKAISHKFRLFSFGDGMLIL